MGVLECDRYRCSNIMCDRLSYEYGYICYECFEELIELGINADIKDFMNSKKHTKTSRYTAVEFFSEVFPTTFRE